MTARAEILEYLEDSQMVHRSKDRYHWSSEIYPAQEVSLRSASPENFVILNESNNSEVIGEVRLFLRPDLPPPAGDLPPPRPPVPGDRF